MATTLDLIINSFNKAIVSPINAFGVGGFVFDIDGETTVNLTTEITDHYLEDNTAIQDHIAIRPKKVILKSYVGELVFREDDTTDTAIQKVVQKLTTLSSYLPALSSAATQITDAVKNSRQTDFSLKNVTLETINKTVDYWALLKNLSVPQSRQMQAYKYFKALMDQKVLVSVQTPFEFMSNMAVESITAIQGEDSRFISDFSITLKEIRTVSILNAVAGKNQYQTTDVGPEQVNQGRASIQKQVLTTVGNLEGIPNGDGYNLDDLMTDDMYKAIKKPIPFPTHP